MTDIADIFALAEMYSELTKCSLEVALSDINARTKAVKTERRDEIQRAASEIIWPPNHPKPQLPEPEPPAAMLPEYQPVLLPYNAKAFLGAMRWATPGQGYTVAELCSAAGIIYPPASKASTHKLVAAGWTKTDIRRTHQNCKCSVYVKPVARTLDEYRVAAQ